MTCEAITVVPARTVVVNMAAQIIITTAHDSTLLTPITVVPGTTWRWILPVLQLLLGLAVFELGLRHVLGILPVLILWRLSVHWSQQLLFLLHANVRL